MQLPTENRADSTTRIAIVTSGTCGLGCSTVLRLGSWTKTRCVRDVETAAQVLNPTQPMNELIRRATSNNR